MRALLFLAALVSFPATAFAGDCPVCDTAADCNRPGLECSDTNPCFCVEWDMSPGCGALTRICCPGQGCNVGEGGRPSCEGDRCTVIDGPYTGGDAGMPSIDAGPMPGTDAGPPVDAAGRDAGSTTPRDAGTTVPMPRDDGGCDCSTSGSAGGGAIVALAMLYALARRRRR
jgi:MYXO-CTERM domain-containing protein